MITSEKTLLNFQLVLLYLNKNISFVAQKIPCLYLFVVVVVVIIIIVIVIIIVVVVV
jgi:hypothetical protein